MANVRVLQINTRLRWERSALRRSARRRRSPQLTGVLVAAARHLAVLPRVTMRPPSIAVNRQGVDVQDAFLAGEEGYELAS